MEPLLREMRRVADTPDALPHLRRFILELAVRGRLVQQDPADEPSEVLLKGRTVRPAEIPFLLPKGWCWTSFGKLGQVLGGGTPSKSHPEFWVGAVPWVTPKDMKRDRIGDSIDHINEAAIEASAVKLIPSGSLLMVTRGMILAHSFPAALTTAPVTINQDMKALVPFDPRLQDMLLLIAKGMRTTVLGLVERSTHGTGRLASKAILELPLPMPPVDEQRRIVDKVGELMRLCDGLEAAQREREAQRDETRRAFLRRLAAPSHSAVSSDAQFLVVTCRRLVTTSGHVLGLRQSILDLAVGGRLASSDPSSWREVALGELLAEDTRNGYSRKPDGAADGIAILKISAGTMRNDGIVEETEHKLIGGVTAADRERLSLRSGDLLACRFNGNRGAVGVLALFTDQHGLGPIFPDKLIRLRADPSQVLPGLLRWWSRASLIESRTNEYRATTVGNWGISATNLKLVVYPVPPLPEQRRIVSKVDELMALCDRLEAALAGAHVGRVRLLESLLREALHNAGDVLARVSDPE